MKKTDRKVAKIFALFVFVLIIVYFLTRLYHLLLIPIFTDEAIYIRWGLIGSRDAAQRLISLEDGKQPFFTWVMMVLFRLFSGSDPLFVGRLTSILSGFLSLLGIMLLTKELFGRTKTAFFAGFLYLVIPFYVMYDRLALYDSWVGALSLWSLYLSVILVRKLRLDTALLLALVLGAAALNKSSGFLSAIFLPALILIIPLREKFLGRRVLKFLLLSALAVGLSQIYYSVLRLSPLFHIVGQKNNVFVYPFAEWLQHPFNYVLGNLRGMFDWMIGYISPPVFWLAIGAVFAGFFRLRERLLLLLWWIFPFVSLAMFAKVLYPRFVLFMSLPLVILAAFTLSFIHDRLKDGIRNWIVGFLFLPLIYTSYFVLTDPWHALIPEADKGQILNDWPSGGGVREARDYFLKESEKGPLAVYTDGTFGLLPYAIEIYTMGNENIFLKGIWPVPQEVPAEINEMALVKPTFMVFNQNVRPSGWPTELIFEHQKGAVPGKTLRVYRIVSLEKTE